MNKPCARITLDLQQASTPTFVAVKKSDIGREIRITLSDGGFPYEISADCYAVLTGTKPDGNILYNHCDIEGNTIVYEITEQTTAAAGRMKAEVKLYGADDILVTSATFRIIIDGTVYTDDKVESSSEFSALTQLISQVVEIIQKYSDVTTVTKTSELINDSGFITNAVSDLVNYYTKTDIGNLISNIPKFRISVVSYLPTEDISETTIYLLPGGDGSDLYTEYLRVDGKWEILGSQRVDLTGYATEEWVEQKLEEHSGGNVDLEGYATEQWVKDQKYLTEVPDGYAKTTEIPTKPEDIGAQPSGNYALKSEIPSVPVQSVNGKTGEVKLSASDVKARPDDWMPSAQEVGALPNTYTPPNQTAEQVGADPKGTAASAVSQHNTADDSHNDIRLELKVINARLTAFFDSDNQTLDELSEIVAYITSNKSLIDSITTSKVSVADIVNNLTSNVSNKPLSAAQGVVLKGLIDAVSNSLSNYQPKGDYALRSELPTVPTKVSAFTNDAGYLTEHQDISGKLDANKLPEAIDSALAQAKDSGDFDGLTPYIGDNGNWFIGDADTGVKAEGEDGTNGASVTVSKVTESTEDGGSNVVEFSDGKKLTVKNGSTGSAGATDNVEILLPSELVAVVGVEFNAYYKSFIQSNRPLDNFEVKCYLNDTSLPYKLYKECFRLTAVEANVGSYTLTVQVKDIISGRVKAEKTAILNIIENRTLNTKNVLYLGDSLTFSRGGLYPAEIQYNLSGGKLVSIGSQTASEETNGIGNVKHEGYNGASVGDFLSENIRSGFVNPFYNPSTGEFDLAYFMTSQGYSQIDAVCLNLGHNNIGDHVNAVSGLQTIISKIHEYNADIPVIISLIEPLAGQDGWTKKTKSTSIEMIRHWKNLISAYISAFDNGKISNVYLSAPYLNIDTDNDFPTETVARSARDATEIVRQSDAMHPSKIGTLKMADVYYANLIHRIPEDNAIYYSVTNKLTNVITNNNAGSVKEGTSYTATLTPADGYVLDSVTVTMGGNTVTVTNGVISISGVTGDIVITATAKVYVPSYTNLAKPSTANDASPNTALSADEWLNGYYISSKSISAKADLVVTNKIPCTINDTMRIKGFTDTGNISGGKAANRFRVLSCDANGNALQTELMPAMSSSTAGTGRLEKMDASELENGIYCFTLSNFFDTAMSKNMAYVRITGHPIDGNNANVIVTVNEPIE